MAETKRINPIAFRLSEGENTIIEAYIDRIKKRNPYMNASEIIRETLFINPRTVNDLDRTWLRDQFRSIHADEHPGADAQPLAIGNG